MKKILIILLTGFMALSASAQSYKVIVNVANSTTSITAKEASNYFLKKTIKWTDGTTISPVDQSANSGVRDQFTLNVHGKSVSAIKSYWQQTIFSGKGTPPAEKASDDEVIAFVKSNSGGIGYVSSSASLSGVKAITITD